MTVCTFVCVCVCVHMRACARTCACVQFSLWVLLPTMALRKNQFDLVTLIATWQPAADLQVKEWCAGARATLLDRSSEKYEAALLGGGLCQVNYTAADQSTIVTLLMLAPLATELTAAARGQFQTIAGTLVCACAACRCGTVDRCFTQPDPML